MQYKNRIKSQITAGLFHIGMLTQKEHRQLLDEVNTSNALSTASIGYLAQVFHLDDTEDLSSALVLDAIRHHIHVKGYMSAEIVMIIQGIFRPTHVSAQKITRPLADFLFDLNDMVADSECNHSAWGNFFARMVSQHLLQDSAQPNEINDEEADWLIERILSDGQYDYVEQELIPMLAGKAQKMPETLKHQIEILNGAIA